MKNKLTILNTIGVILISLFSFSQSDEPCTAGNLPVSSNCTPVTYTNATATASEVADPSIPAPGCGSYSGGDVWFTITVPASGNVILDATSGVVTDGAMAVYSGTCSSLTLVTCNDDGGAGLMPSISLTGQTSGATLWVRFWEFSNDNNGTFDLCAYEPPPPPTNVSCAIPDPICSGSPIIFTAQANNTQADIVNPGNDYGCLISQPNPSWYYLKIGTGGNLVIDVTAGSDVDFAIWGPYPDVVTAVANCGSYPAPVDCSFSFTNVEQVSVTGVAAGEVYVLLVTNYANSVQTITVQDAGANTATTDCSIVPLPVELVDFEAERNESEVFLSWSTVSEINNDYFIVERSEDGTNWSSFDFVDGHGNSQELIHYSSIDRNFSTDVNYYRIKQFDFDGKMSYSSIVSVNPNGKTIIQLYPNPVNTNLTIVSNEEMNRVRMYRLDGTMVFEDGNKSAKKLSINVQDFMPGVYYIDVVTTNGSLKEKIVIQ